MYYCDDFCPTSIYKRLLSKRSIVPPSYKNREQIVLLVGEKKKKVKVQWIFESCGNYNKKELKKSSMDQKKKEVR